jgi:hypothetical protein
MSTKNNLIIVTGSAKQRGAQIKWYRRTIKLVTQHFYFKKKPNKYIWVDFKITHQLDECTQHFHVCPLTWGNNSSDNVSSKLVYVG